ncbi:MAG TPA: DUF1015 domain-containing protein, partial [Puia sp.]|nr:DUF1015 domain-containing protein [Puia sp.]
MATIKPFKALRPPVEFSARVASRPYDVMNAGEARAEAEGNPYSFLHITRSEIDLPLDTDLHSKAVYDKAGENLAAFRQKKYLYEDKEPCYYIYQLVMGPQNQTGLVCVSSVSDYDNGIIKKHELTRPEKELDRINHIKSTRAQTGNVFLTYRTNERLNKEIEDWKASHQPVYDFIASDGIIHRVWVVNDNETIDRITRNFAEHVPATYIADGHHRAASAAKVRHEQEPLSTEADYFLTTLFPADQLRIMDYNRLARDLNSMTTNEFIHGLEKNFMVGRMESAFSPKQLHE